MRRERELETKKKWEKPKLIILVRGDRREGVLTVCKTDAYASVVQTGADYLYKTCAGTLPTTPPQCFMICSNLADS